jgi:4-amino-4-deoxy-L-arabinose transferase-like glycosyltransferase
MTRKGVPAPAHPPLARPWLWLAPVLALAAAIVLATPVITWRTGADEGFYLRYATRVAADGPGAFPALFRDYLSDPVGSRLFPSPARLTAIAYDAAAVRLAGPRFEALAHASLTAFLVLIVLVFAGARPVLGDRGALATALLLATSPLGLGMARRALTDSLNAALLTVCLGLVIHGLATRRGSRWWGATSAAYAIAFLGRELNLILVPLALALVALDAIRHRRRPSGVALASVSLVPAVLAAGVLALAAGGIGVAWQALAAVVTQPGTNEYALRFGSGPWYRYLLDHLLLSPWTTLLYVAWTGYAVGTRLDDDELLAWTLVPPLFLLCVMPFAKFVRWALFLDVPLRLGTAALLAAQAGTPRARAMIAVMTLALVASQLLSFHRVFVVGDVYDPTSFGLLALEGFLP